MRQTQGRSGHLCMGDKALTGDTSSRLVSDVCNRHSDLSSSNSAAPRKLDRVVEPRRADAVASRFLWRGSFFPSLQLCSLANRMGDNMVEILNFSRETAFGPETIRILAAALDEAWERLRQSGSRLAGPAYSRPMREAVAKRASWKWRSVACKTVKR